MQPSADVDRGAQPGGGRVRLVVRPLFEFFQEAAERLEGVSGDRSGADRIREGWATITCSWTSGHRTTDPPVGRLPRP
jgi:hypothetical protein